MANITKAVTHDGDAGMKAGEKKVAKRLKKRTEEAQKRLKKTTGEVVQLEHSSLCIANCSL